MADFNGLTKKQEDEIIEEIIQEQQFSEFSGRAWFLFFKNHLLKITLIFYIPVFTNLYGEYGYLIIGILFLCAIKIEYRTKMIDDKITYRQLVEVVVRGGVIGNSSIYATSISFTQTIIDFIKRHKWILGGNFLLFLILNILIEYENIFYYIHYLLQFMIIINIFYISFLQENFVFTGSDYSMYSFSENTVKLSDQKIIFFCLVITFLFSDIDYGTMIIKQESLYRVIIKFVAQIIMFNGIKRSFMQATLENIVQHVFLKLKNKPS